MATHDVDQKLLGRLARETEPFNVVLSSSLFKILGISVRLTEYLIIARKLRKLDSPRKNREEPLLHPRILFLSREGLTLTEQGVLAYTEEDQYHGPLVIELKIFAYKLRASFYHIFCLFHNDPPVSDLVPITAAPGLSATNPRLANMSPNIQQNVAGTTPAGQDGPDPVPGDQIVDQENQPVSAITRPGKSANLRDAIPSMVSEMSYITNPYSVNAISPPPGLSQVPIPMTSTFILPSDNFLPMATLAFNQAASQAAEDLAGSDPLRLSVQLERCAFLWDCVHDFEGSRRLAAQAIRDCQQAEEGMDDSEFEDAVAIIGTLGIFMKRNSQESTPRFGGQTPRGIASPSREVITPLPSIAEAETAAARQQATEQSTVEPQIEQGGIGPSKLPTSSSPSRPKSAKTPPGSPPGQKRTSPRSPGGIRRSPRSPQNALSGSSSSPSRPRTRRGSNGNGAAATRAQRQPNHVARGSNDGPQLSSDNSGTV